MLKVGVQNGETKMEAGKIMREERGKIAKVYQRSSYCIVWMNWWKTSEELRWNTDIEDRWYTKYSKQ